MKYIKSYKVFENTFYYKGPNPTVDLCVFRENDNGYEVLLIKRSDDSPAEPGKWALPGGFHDTDAKKGDKWMDGKETAKEGALRELKEETGLILNDPGELKYVGTYEGGNRDPRDNETSWTKSNLFTIVLTSDIGDNVVGQDDASEAKWIDVKEASEMNLAFDHNKLLQDSINSVLVK